MMRVLVATFLLLSQSPDATDQLRLPFEGRWFVAHGGDTLNVNHHMSSPAQAFGVDFARVAGASMRQLSAGTPRRVEDFYSWGEAVLAPADGTVIHVENGLPDNPLGTKDADRPAGNHVVIALAGGRFVFLAHMQRHSVTVKTGEVVRRGQPLGRCGNSGNSDFPHIHLHVQTTPDLDSGRGLNPVFGPIDVELTGRPFSKVTWPLIRGLFVSNS